MNQALDQHISGIIEGNQRVLDCGCGDGSLLELLKEKKQVSCYGIDVDSDNIITCIQKGLSVFQGDIEEGLREFSDNSFDVVILSQTLQQIANPLSVIKELCRVGKMAIVTFPNFAYWQNRFQLFRGLIPKSKQLPYEWYDTPNIRVVSIKSFKRVCKKENIHILQEQSFSHDKSISQFASNVFAQRALFVIKER